MRDACMAMRDGGAWRLRRCEMCVVLGSAGFPRVRLGVFRDGAGPREVGKGRLDAGFVVCNSDAAECAGRWLALVDARAEFGVVSWSCWVRWRMRGLGLAPRRLAMLVCRQWSG